MSKSKQNYSWLNERPNSAKTIIERAKEAGCKLLFLESNRILTPALKLYERLGFIEVDKDISTSAYQRSNIYMEMMLN